MNGIERLDVDGELLRSFLAIAEARSLTVAAARLHRTQSAVSVRLAKLEAALGRTLFERTPSGMRLTDAGERLVPVARTALDGLRAAADLFADPLRGTIHVGLPDDYEDAVFERALARFAKAHPEVAVRATSGCTSGYRAAVARGEMDLAVVSGPDARDGDPLGEVPTLWMAHADLAIDPDRPVPLAVLDRSCWWRDLPTRALSDAGRPYDVVLRTSSFGSLRAAVRSGVAVAALPATSVEPGLRRLGRADGLPPLPSSHRVIVMGADAPQGIARAMAGALGDVCGRRAGPEG